MTLPLEIRNEIYRHLFNTSPSVPWSIFYEALRRSNDDNGLSNPSPGCCIKTLVTGVDEEDDLLDVEDFDVHFWIDSRNERRNSGRSQQTLTMLAYESLSGDPAILRTCRQIYHEALPYLYADKAFERCILLDGLLTTGKWEYLRPNTGRKACYLPKQHLHHVQHCKIVLEDLSFERVSPEKFANHIHYFSDKDRKLKSLSLEFIFRSEPIYPDVMIGDQLNYQQWVKALAESSKISQSVAALGITQNIDIKVTDSLIFEEHRTPGAIFQSLVEAIANAKGWFHDEVVYKKKVDIVDAPSWAQREVYEHQWTWRIRSTLEKVL